MNQYIGKTLGSYQILEQVGQGGMATIFKAYQPSMDRYVAVKILPSHFTEDETFVARFTQEARTLARLEHPHILPVHDYGEQEGITYLVMRYIDAGTLKDLISQRGPLELEEATRLLGQVARALGYAHSQGVVHRDIKPTNVLIDERGDSFLTDFGIAKLVAGTAQFTATGAIVGTPAYMSPEQGLADPVDHRSDIYSLGVVLHEMVTGRVPYEAETPLAVLLKHVNDPLPPPRQIKPDLPEAVERVILKAMAKSPADRFASAEALADALQKAVSDVPTQPAMAPPPPLAEPAQVTEPARTVRTTHPETTPAPRKPLPWRPIAGGVAALAVALVAALLLLPNLGGDGAQATPTPRLALAKATTASDDVAAAEPPAAAAPAASPTPQPAAAEPPVADKIVVDNTDPGFSIEAGDWGSCWNGDCGGVSYGDDFVYADPACSDCRARFDVAVPAAGEYDVWTWWPRGTNRATDTPFTIFYADGPFTVTVDQREGGSAWYKLGTFAFEADEVIGVVVASTDSGFANADAVALVTPAGAKPPTGPAAVYGPPAPGDGIVVDNNAPDFTVEEGYWGDCWGDDCGGLSYGVDFRYADPGCTACRARFDFNVPTAGEYDVWTWWPQGDDRATDTPYTIVYNAESFTVKVDQRNDGSTWYKLGTFTFQAGESVSVIVTGADSGFANADAVALSPAGAEVAASGWTNYTNRNFVRALARQDDYLWAGGSGGLVRWDLNDGSYVNFGLADGLASTWVNDLLVDEEGIMWVATDAGISRFDGETWLTFSELDGLDSDEVHALLLDPDGGLWAGTQDGELGLSYYDGTDWGHLLPPLPFDGPTVRHLAMEKNYGLWANLDGEGLAYFNGTEWEIYTSDDDLPDAWFSDLLLTDDDTLLASFDDGVVRRDPETGDWETISQLDGLGISAMHQASDGTFWFGSDQGLVRYDPETGDWQAFEAQPGAIPDESVSTIIEDENGLYLGTDGAGIVFYDGSGWETWVTDDELAGNDVWAIRQDGSGALWFLHEDGDGLSRYDPAGDTWQTFGDDEGAWDWPTAVTVDGDGTLWIGGYAGIKQYDERGWQTFAPDQLDDDTVFGVAFAPDGTQWFRTYAGVIRHDPATDEWTTFTADDHPALKNAQVIYITRDGTVWAGGDAGLVYHDQGSWREPDATGDAPTRDVDEIAETPDGELWVVADGALYNLAEDHWARFNWPDGWIETMAVGPDGSIWLGYDGLARFDPASGEWKVWSTGDGLVYWNVEAIHVTPEGVVWVGTEGGVSRYRPATGLE